ncbi:MAG: RNA polymerase sigma factor [Candidatus Hydrogenedentes bacterium]|nr:RNA polymerase sigma factor [Candidatus Hydrogenedentota bacterium]
MQMHEIEQVRRVYEIGKNDFLVYAVTLTHDLESAEDIVHAVFERLLRKQRLPRECRPYVFRAIRNAALDARRRNKVREDGALPLAPPNEAANPLLQLQVREALAVLEEDEREVIVLKLYTGLSFKEIAEVRGVPQSTASSWYYRALEKLRPLLGGE